MILSHDLYLKQLIHGRENHRAINKCLLEKIDYLCMLEL